MFICLLLAICNCNQCLSVPTWSHYCTYKTASTQLLKIYTKVLSLTKHGHKFIFFDKTSTQIHFLWQNINPKSHLFNKTFFEHFREPIRLKWGWRRRRRRLGWRRRSPPPPSPSSSQEASPQIFQLFQFFQFLQFLQFLQFFRIVWKTVDNNTINNNSTDNNNKNWLIINNNNNNSKNWLMIDNNKNTYKNIIKKPLLTNL